MRPKGCRYCNNTGYKGRTAIHEILTIDRPIREMISRRATMEEVKDYAIEKQGMKTLKECGVELVEAGSDHYGRVDEGCLLCITQEKAVKLLKERRTRKES